MRAFAALAAALLVAACQSAGTLAAEDAWVRLPAAANRPGAAYFTLKGGPEAATLVAVSTPAAVRTELHETVQQDNGTMSMAPIRDIAVPAAGEVKFDVGGKHVMLFDLSPSLKPGGTVPLRLAFADGKSIEVEAKLVGAGDPAP